MQTPWYLGNTSAVHFWPAGIVLLAAWSVVWTGLALWHAAKRDDKAWFILFLVVHTAGLIEILYLVFVAGAFRTSSGPVTRRRKK